MSVLMPFYRKHLGTDLPDFAMLNNMIDNFFADTWPMGRPAYDTFRLDIREDNDGYTVEAELPGIKKEEIAISLSDGTLSIAVNKDESREDKNNNYIRRERRCCSMKRSVYLADADNTGIRAKLDNGILSISIPKKHPTDNNIKIEID